MSVFPFSYSCTSFVPKRHGPSGYVDYSGYKPWLRDEYTYRCVYCLSRERWCPAGHVSFGADHIKPKSAHLHLITDYENLVYSCNQCNSRKKEWDLPKDLLKDSLGLHVKFFENGEVSGLTRSGRELIERLLLDDSEYVKYRSTIMRIWKLATAGDAELAEFFGFPSNVQDLAVLRPPAGNRRSDGILTSAYVLRKSGLLPAQY